MNNDNQGFFFCYSENLFKFLRQGRNIKYICVGLHVESHCKFWLFKRDPELIQALDEYRQRGFEMGVIKG
ncbi:hypothetical protein [Paenibacillus sp. FSL K6-2524]|uniref:hypothetical protein n=1 Tax=Paenibacillus sp. FSL K6-2524 TaxID=2954516 RepID=UPI0030FAE308